MDLNIIYNEDCLTTLRRMDDDMLQLTVTSPPYDQLKEYDGYSWDVVATARLLYEKTSYGGVVVWIVSDSTKDSAESRSAFRHVEAFCKAGFQLFDTMIWYKPNTFNFGSNKAYRQTFDYMFVFSKGAPGVINLIKDVPNKLAGATATGGRKHPSATRDATPQFVVAPYRRRDNVWTVPVSNKNYGHPAVFPEQLAIDHIISWSEPGQLVYDPFIGSGTTAIAAIKTGRQWVASEISEEYCKIAHSRILLESLPIDSKNIGNKT